LCFLSSPVQLVTLATVTDKNSRILLISSGASFGRQALTVITPLITNAATSTGRRLESGTSSLLVVTEVRLPGRVLALRRGLCPLSGALSVRDVLPRSRVVTNRATARSPRVTGPVDIRRTCMGQQRAQAAPNQAPFMAIAPGAVGVYWVAVSQRGGAVDLLGSEPTRAARLLRGLACHGCSVRRVRRCATA